MLNEHLWYTCRFALNYELFKEARSRKSTSSPVKY